MPRPINRLVNEQVNRWQIERKGKKTQPDRSDKAPNVITLSNALGSAGIEIAQRVGELLGIPVYDREIVEHIATTKKVQVSTVETLDERVQSGIDDYVTNLFRARNFDRSDYMEALTRTILALRAHGSCLFIGRGSAHIIPPGHVLAVRTVAPRGVRLKRVQAAHLLDRKEAERLLERTDAQREGFIRHHFGRDINDPLEYDLVLNTNGYDTNRAAQVIVDAYHRKFPDRAKQAAVRKGA